MALDLHNRFFGVFDLDNTAYADKDETGHKISSHFPENFVKAAQSLMPGLCEATILDYAERSYVLCGMSSVGFADIARDYGHTPEHSREVLHTETSRLWFEAITRDYPHRLRPCPETIALFSSLAAQGMRYGCLSHSCKENWVEPVLDRLGLLRFFDVVMGAACSDFASKQLSTTPIRNMLNNLGAEPHESLFVEDSLKNLQTSKDFDPRLLTVYLHHGNPPDRVPSFVDLSVSNHLEAMRVTEEAHLHRRPRYVMTNFCLSSAAPALSL